MGTSFSYDDADHQVIFDSVNGGVRSGPLQEASRAWQRLGEEIGAAGKSYVQRAISGILTSREGVAAAAAVAAVGAMLPWMDDVARIAASTAQRAQSQADYWVTAQHNVPPVPPAPTSTGFLGDPAEWAAERMDWFPGVTSDRREAEQHRQEAAEQARQAMRVYQSSSNDNIDPEPAFTTPQALDGSIGGYRWSAPTPAVSPLPRCCEVGAPVPTKPTCWRLSNQQLSNRPPVSRWPRCHSSLRAGTPRQRAVSRRHRAGGPMGRHPTRA
ncbi:MAG: PPE domain-containing protein [Pseudonocardiaceae bacterium]